MAVGLATRLRKVEQVFDTTDHDAARAYLLACFAGAAYDGHREAIVRALLAGRRSYTFERCDAQGQVIAYYMVWWNPPYPIVSFEAEPPVVKAILLGDPAMVPDRPRTAPPEPAPIEPRPLAPPEAATHGAPTAH